jgi:ceramide glucosyltransferase
MSIELFIVAALSIYFIIGVSQIFKAVKMKKEAESRPFKRKDVFVSVIIPIRGVSRTTQNNLESVCKQNYQHFEVIFVAEVREHPAYKIARSAAEKYPNTKVLLSGPHDGRKTTGKCHNLIFGVKHAKGEVFLFGDSDVSYSRDWISKMVSPLNEIVEGRRIHAVTSPFFIEPEGITGKFIALSISLVTFTAGLTRKSQRFPSYVSGASIAVTREIFHELHIDEIWSENYNDDLVFAVALKDRGYNIYNQLANLNHPNEAFDDSRQIKEKLIRWVVTISTFSHGDLRAEVPLMAAKNLQFQAALIAGIILYLLGFSFALVLAVMVAGYIYLVAYRWVVGWIIEEKGMSRYYFITPVSVTAMMLFFVIVRLFYRSFSWEGKTYDVKGKRSR